MFSNCKDLVQFIENSKRVTPKKDLSNMLYYLNSLGNPHKNLPVIHITGTNGKGSVVSYLENVFIAYKLNVGSFTSPYIKDFNERIRYNGISISDEDLLKYGNLIYKHFPIWQKELGETPAFFEFVTLICFMYFSNITSLDVLILEVGIGGRLDSTNVVDSMISAVTSISFDHMNLLGNTLEDILKEKLGIVKNNSIPILNLKDQDLINSANSYLLDHLKPIVYPKYSKLNIIKCDFDGSIFEYDNKIYEIQMIGYHQIENAITAIEIIKKYFEEIKTDLSFNQVLLNEGLKNTKWLGRFEKIQNKPLIYVDGAHNSDGVLKIVEFLKQNKQNKSLRGIIAISDNKDKEQMIKMFDDIFDEIIFTKFSYTRSSVAEELYELSNNKNKLLMHSLDEINEYINKEEKDINIFIGSLYFVSEVKKYFNK